MTVGSGESYTVSDGETPFGNYSIGTSWGNNGGVFYVNDGSLVVGNDCEFNSNTANRGGAIYVDSSGSVDIGDNCKFDDNTAVSQHTRPYNA